MQPRFFPPGVRLLPKVRKRYLESEEKAFYDYLDWSGHNNFEDYRVRQEVARQAWVKALEWMNCCWPSDNRSDDWL